LFCIQEEFSLLLLLHCTGVDPRDSHMPGKHPIIELHPQSKILGSLIHQPEQVTSLLQTLESLPVSLIIKAKPRVKR
jgi:hypothetical protein